MINRRYAALGWLVWKIGKKIGKRKAKQAMPTIDRETKRPNKGALASVAAALGGLLWFKKKRKGRGTTDFGE